MLRMDTLRRSAAAAALTLTVAWSADAISAPTPSQQSPDDATPVVVEMFVSQSCEACGPAVRHLRALTARPDVVALQWHVDYWDHTDDGERGRWMDPYAKTAFSDRQRWYNSLIRGRNRVYTPQAVIDGVEDVVGSKPHRLDEAIVQYAKIQKTAQVSITRNNESLTIEISNAANDFTALLVRFKERAVTNITGGDNHGQTWKQANLVLAMEALGKTAPGRATFSARAPEAGESCAVLIQDPQAGRIIGARYCPD